MMVNYLDDFGGAETKEKIMNLINIKRGAILRIVDLITAQYMYICFF
jgi:hypothetical protein